VRPILERTYGAENANLWFQRWRLFLLGSAATFGYAGGSEWSVHHYVMRRRNRAAYGGTENRDDEVKPAEHATQALADFAKK